MDLRIELVPLDVSDVDRSVAFYGSTLGWPVDFDVVVHAGLRFVQVTPPGSACSVCFGTGLGMLAEGTRQHVQVVVDDADEVVAHLRGLGVECTDVEELAWGRFTNLEDPDGNRWVFQQLPVRPDPA